MPVANSDINSAGLSAFEKDRLKRRLHKLQRSLEALPSSITEKDVAIGAWPGVDEWAESTLRTTNDLIFQLGSERRRAAAVGTAYNRAISAYDAAAGIVDRRHAGLSRDDFRLAKTAIQQCIESGSHLL